MDRQTKIDQLKKLASGKLSPAQLLEQLPIESEMWHESKTDGKIIGVSRMCRGKRFSTYAEFQEYSKRQKRKKVMLVTCPGSRKHRAGQINVTDKTEQNGQKNEN